MFMFFVISLFVLSVVTLLDTICYMRCLNNNRAVTMDTWWAKYPMGGFILAIKMSNNK